MRAYALEDRPLGLGATMADSLRTGEVPRPSVSLYRLSSLICNAGSADSLPAWRGDLLITTLVTIMRKDGVFFRRAIFSEGSFASW